MARNIDDGIHQRKKQKVTPRGAGTSQKRATVPLSKTQKKRILRRLSSVNSQTSSTDVQTQRRDYSSLSSKHNLGRPVASPRNPDEEDEEDEEEEEEEEDYERAMLKRLDTLLKDQQYRMIGKMFALKIWAWPSSSWWIGDDSATEVVEKPAKKRLDRAEEFALRRTKLDAKKKQEFLVYLLISVGISRDEWMKQIFKSEVRLTILFIVAQPILTAPR